MLTRSMVFAIFVLMHFLPKTCIMHLEIWNVIAIKVL